MTSGKADRELDILKMGANWLGLELNSDQLSQFATYAAELMSWTKKFNLTSITDIEGIQIKHFLDSLTCFLGFPEVKALRSTRPLAELPTLSGTLVIDVGAGAGFPGVPLAIARPEISLVLLESARKKTTFLDHLVRVLGLRSVTVLTGRAEEVARLPGHREHYDIVVARAVANLAVLAEYCLPFARIKGRFIAPKKGDIRPEIESAWGAIAALGGNVPDVLSVDVPRLLDARSLVLIDKVRSTPSEFPRCAGVPGKRPLKAKPS